MENVIIVGSGPAGYTAALYAARADLEPLVIEGFAWGGLLQNTTEVENFPGFPAGILGPELMQNMRDQAERFGARFITDEATVITLDPAGRAHRVELYDETFQARALILATGASPLTLGVPGEAELSARGVSYCAVCDAAFFRDQDTVVVGGGDSAMEDAIYLAKFARSVTLVHRSDTFRASKVMLGRARATENLRLLTNHQVTEFQAGAGGTLARVRMRDTMTGDAGAIDATGAFIAIGHRPNSGLVAGQLDVDAHGYVKVAEPSTLTRVAGVFACGDLTDPNYRQAVTAAGTGCRAALDAERFLAHA